MPWPTDKQLEERLTAAAKSIKNPPTSLDELLNLLDRVEELLSKVEQSPPKSMLRVLAPLVNGLVTEALLKHSDIDVKVGVASCISEITRITAPDAPYDDDTMKDVFQLIVSCFEDLSEVSSRSYELRATILETMAKVRSFVIMLDLKCDQMIIDMFQHFLKAIRAYHPNTIFGSMETIMILVIKEIDDISTDLLAPLLDTLRINNKNATPIARKLAESVIQKSADKLRPYLKQALTSLETSLDEYNEVIASVCQETTDTAVQSNKSILKNPPLERVKDRLKQKNINLQYTEDAVKLLATLGFDPNFGARPVKRVIQHMVEILENEIAMEILIGGVKDEDSIVLDVEVVPSQNQNQNRLCIRKVKNSAQDVMVANN